MDRLNPFRRNPKPTTDQASQQPPQFQPTPAQPIAANPPVAAPQPVPAAPPQQWNNAEARQPLRYHNTARPMDTVLRTDTPLRMETAGTRLRAILHRMVRPVGTRLRSIPLKMVLGRWAPRSRIPRVVPCTKQRDDMGPVSVLFTERSAGMECGTRLSDSKLSRSKRSERCGSAGSSSGAKRFQQMEPGQRSFQLWTDCGRLAANSASRSDQHANCAPASGSTRGSAGSDCSASSRRGAGSCRFACSRGAAEPRGIRSAGSAAGCSTVGSSSTGRSGTCDACHIASSGG